MCTLILKAQLAPEVDRAINTLTMDVSRALDEKLRLLSLLSELRNALSDFTVDVPELRCSMRSQLPSLAIPQLSRELRKLLRSKQLSLSSRRRGEEVCGATDSVPPPSHSSLSSVLAPTVSFRPVVVLAQPGFP
jgi:hypothetical protein